jgi:hypothetical protein
MFSWIKAFFPLGVIGYMLYISVPDFARFREQRAADWEEVQDEKARVAARAAAEGAIKARQREEEGQAQQAETNREKQHIVRYRTSTYSQGNIDYTTSTPVSEWQDNTKKWQDEARARRMSVK